MTDGEAGAGPAQERKGAPGPEVAPAHAPDAGSTPAAEAEPAVEAEPVIEAAPAVEAEPVIEAAPAVEAEPAVESVSDPAPEVETQTVPEQERALDDVAAGPVRPRIRERRRRDPLASALIGILTLLLGFAFAVQVRSADTPSVLAGAREEDLVRILDELNAREDRLRGQIAEQRTALDQLTNSDSQSATALEEARRRAEAIGILNGTIAARGPGLRMDIGDPDGVVRVEDLLDAIEELRGAGAETMQLSGVRVGVSTAITGQPPHLLVDGHPITAPYEFLVIGSPQDMETAMNIPGGVVQRITGLGGTVRINQQAQVLVDALRPLDTPQYASPKTGK
jgi:uncharacterized protein YlxW (UPF0749 family)